MVHIGCILPKYTTGREMKSSSDENGPRCVLFLFFLVYTYVYFPFLLLQVLLRTMRNRRGSRRVSSPYWYVSSFSYLVLFTNGLFWMPPPPLACKRGDVGVFF
jgi:hypothetical protein